MKLLALFFFFIALSFAIECDPNNNCQTCRQCDRNFFECWGKAEEQKEEEDKNMAFCKCFTTYYNCAQRVGCLYFPQVHEICSNFDSSVCPEHWRVCSQPEKIGDGTPKSVEFQIFEDGTQLNPSCGDNKKFGEGIELGKCHDNDEYGNYRLDVVDATASALQGGRDDKKDGVRVQFHFGCKKDDAGECYECGHIDEVGNDECYWGCQVKSPEADCYSFKTSGWDDIYNPYVSVDLNITFTVDQDCGDGKIEDYINRINEEAQRESSLVSDMEIEEWECHEIVIPSAPQPENQKRQDPVPTQKSVVWVNFKFTGEWPRVGLKKVAQKYSGNDGELQKLGLRQGVVVVTVSLETDIYHEDNNGGLTGGAIFGIVIFVLLFLVVIGVAVFFVMNGGGSENV